MVDRLAQRYGCPPSVILQEPVDLMFELQHVIVEEAKNAG